MTQAQNAQLAKDHSIRESAGASRFHPMAPDQKIPHALIDMMVDRSIGQQASSVAEVRRPSSQHLIQTVTYLFPRSNVAGPQQVSHFLLVPV